MSFVAIRLPCANREYAEVDLSDLSWTGEFSFGRGAQSAGRGRSRRGRRGWRRRALPVAEATAPGLEGLDTAVDAFGRAVGRVENDGVDDAPQARPDIPPGARRTPGVYPHVPKSSKITLSASEPLLSENAMGILLRPTHRAVRPTPHEVSREAACGQSQEGCQGGESGLPFLRLSRSVWPYSKEPLHSRQLSPECVAWMAQAHQRRVPPLLPPWRTNASRALLRP